MYFVLFSVVVLNAVCSLHGMWVGDIGIKKILLRNDEHTETACPPPFTQVEGASCYFAGSEYLPHDKAERFCEGLGANLASLESVQEAKRFHAWFNTVKDIWTAYWLSGKLVRNQWLWGTGVAIDNRLWGPDQPNNAWQDGTIRFAGSVYGQHHNSANPPVCEIDTFGLGEVVTTAVPLETTEATTIPLPETTEEDAPIVFTQVVGASCYYVSQTYLPQNEAESYCRSIGSNLTSLETPEESVRFHRWINSFADIYTAYWLSGRRVSQDKWQWGTGKEIDSRLWASGQPNNKYQDGTIRFAGSLYAQVHNSANPPVCEIDTYGLRNAEDHCRRDRM